MPLQIDGQVVFPYHVLLLIIKNALLVKSTGIESVYGRNTSVEGEEDDVFGANMLVRCSNWKYHS